MKKNSYIDFRKKFNKQFEYFFIFFFFIFGLVMVTNPFILNMELIQHYILILLMTDLDLKFYFSL